MSLLAVLKGTSSTLANTLVTHLFLYPFSSSVMSKYTNNSTVRQDAHDEIETKFCGGHADDLDTSSTSLHLDGGSPTLKVEGAEVFVYHGSTRQYRLQKLSDLNTDDRTFAPSGHNILSDAVAQFYKALARALDDKDFRLEGEFDCANAYVKTGMSTSQFRALPKVNADTLYPYYYRHSSGVKGNLVYDKILPPSGEAPTGRVSCINVKRAGELSEFLPNGHVVYLGGDHEETDLPRHQSRSLDPNSHSKYVQYRPHASLVGPGAVDNENLYISSPFPHTWRGGETGGLNIALARLHNGHFLYWSTDCSPSAGSQISQLPFHDISTDFFYDRTGAIFQPWPIYVNDEPVQRYDLFEGAWVMRGTHLVQDVREHNYPPGVLDRLRGGFFRSCATEVVPSFSRILSRLLKAKQSVERHGGKMFGFNERPDGVVQCDIQSLATYVRLPVDALLAFIPVYGSSFLLFRGTVSFLCMEEMKGVFEITKPLPTGPWMRGQLLDTGTGLLYSRSNNKYFSVTNRGGVSWITEYTRPGLPLRKDLVLEPVIAGVYAT